MREEQLQEIVNRRCDDRGLWWLHIADSRRIPTRGWVDEVVLGAGGALFREIKSADGRLSMAQIRCGRLLAGAGLDYGIWRPEDLDSGRIDTELDAIS